MQRIITNNGKAIIVNGSVLVLKDDTLPPAYKQVEYIILNGQQVNTNWKTKESSRIECKMYHNTTTPCYFWRSTSSSSANNNTTAYNSSAGNWRFGNKTIVVSYSNTKGAIHEFIQDGSGIYIDGASIGSYDSIPSFTSTENLKFGPSQSVSVHFYYFKHVRDGLIISNYIPCKRIADNVAGFYDLANEYFVEIGTAGPDLNNSNT